MDRAKKQLYAQPRREQHKPRNDWAGFGAYAGPSEEDLAGRDRQVEVQRQAELRAYHEALRESGGPSSTSQFSHSLIGARASKIIQKNEWGGLHHIDADYQAELDRDQMALRDRQDALYHPRRASSVRPARTMDPPFEVDQVPPTMGMSGIVHRPAPHDAKPGKRMLGAHGMEAVTAPWITENGYGPPGQPYYGQPPGSREQQQRGSRPESQMSRVSSQRSSQFYEETDSLRDHVRRNSQSSATAMRLSNNRGNDIFGSGPAPPVRGGKKVVSAGANGTDSDPFMFGKDRNAPERFGKRPTKPPGQGGRR